MENEKPTDEEKTSGIENAPKEEKGVFVGRIAAIAAIAVAIVGIVIAIFCKKKK